MSGSPAITAPATVTGTVGQTAPINGVSVSEASTTAGETFTATLTVSVATIAPWM